MSQVLCWPWGLPLSLKAMVMSGVIEGLVRFLLTLLHVDSCNLNSCCQISFLRWTVEIIGELCVWTGVKNCSSIVGQGALHNIE